MSERTLFLQFDANVWTEETLEAISDSLEESLPENASAVLLPKEIDFLTRDETKKFVDDLTDALEETDE